MLRDYHTKKSALPLPSYHLFVEADHFMINFQYRFVREKKSGQHRTKHAFAL